MAEEEEVITEEEATASEASKERRRHGPGFILGIVLGALAGAAAATLFAPPSGEDTQQRLGEEASPFPSAGEGAQPATPTEGFRAMLARMRARVQEAREEGRLAGQEAEAKLRSRYGELTHQENPGA